MFTKLIIILIIIRFQMLLYDNVKLEITLKNEC